MQGKTMAVCVFIFISTIGMSSALFFNRFKADHWDDLKVTWGPLPFKYFNSMPRKVVDAVREGFVSVGSCDSDPNFRGIPFIKDGDKSLVLLYDANGYIAGIQTMVPFGLPEDYPNRGLTPPFIERHDGFYLTAYFVSPANICTKGRSKKEFKKEGTGTMLLIQNGSNPETDYIEIPTSEKKLKSTKWVKGKCFYTMGNHYWYDISKDMDCDNFFPVFLLYNENKLNGFGWALSAYLPSPHMEHPPTSSFDRFMVEPPTCLYDYAGSLSTMHIYLTNSPLLNFC